jgi:predicted N-acetyltransferase YhbS
LTDLRRPERLDTARHDRSRFDCGEPTLDEWLRKKAGQSQRGDTATTWVIADQDYVVVAYAVIAMTSIDRSEAPRDISRGSPDPIPALLLARLAVDQACLSEGIGTALVAHVLTTAVELRTKAAFKAVVVVALHERAKCWWNRFGFESLDSNDPACLDLYLRTADIEATLEAIGGAP